MVNKNQKKNHAMNENTDKYKVDVNKLPNHKKFVWLIDWLFKKSETFCVIEVINSDLSEFACDFLNDLKPFLIDKKTVNKWPGVLYGGEEYGGTQHCFKCSIKSNRIFLKHINSFEQLRMPEMVEDLSFYSNFGEVLFYSVIHEKMEYLVNLDRSEAKMIKEHLDLKYSSISFDYHEYIL